MYLFYCFVERDEFHSSLRSTCSYWARAFRELACSMRVLYEEVSWIFRRLCLGVFLAGKAKSLCDTSCGRPSKFVCVALLIVSNYIAAIRTDVLSFRFCSKVGSDCTSGYLL